MDRRKLLFLLSGLTLLGLLGLLLLLLYLDHHAAGVATTNRADSVRPARAVALRAARYRRRLDLMLRTALISSRLGCLTFGDSHIWGKCSYWVMLKGVMEEVRLHVEEEGKKMNKSKTEFVVDIDPKLPNPLTEDQVDRVFEELESGADFVGGPAVGGCPDPHVLGASFNVMASDATNAIEQGLLAIHKGLGDRSTAKESTVVEVNVEPYIEPGQRELITKAEIARRLGLSRVRIQELAARPNFPAPRQGIGTRSLLYRWGDIKEWQERRSRRAAA